MRIRIVKFGGTSLLSAEAIALAIAWLKELIAGGVLPVVVVSAFGRRGDPYATDTLIGLVRGICAETPSREIALIASCGEIISAVSFTSWLLHSGIDACALTGAQAGIRTESAHEGANILQVKSSSLTRLLEKGVVPVVTGFQGASTSGAITILHRGGSDTTSTALGFALKAEAVDIFSDVPGLFTADPRAFTEARLIPKASFAQAMAMAQQGARVLHPQAINWAISGNFPIFIRQLGERSRNTQIGPNEIGAQSIETIDSGKEDNSIGVFAS
jgi:aspartate kinase